MENEPSELLNLPAGGGETESPRHSPWKILIVDDEGDVHAVTKLVLTDFVFRERGLMFFDAYTSYSACKFMEENPDTAVVLLDVVMESHDAGLKVIRHIREKLKNPRVRIILRTGQPGEAPEHDVIVNYDINDYKCKTELTAQKLFSSLITALRSFGDIVAAEEERCGLVQALEAAHFFDNRSVSWFLSGLLMQAGALLGVAGCDMLMVHHSTDRGEDRLVLVAALGGNEADAGKDAGVLLDAETLSALRRAIGSGQGIFAAEHGTFLLLSGGAAIYVRGEMTLREAEWMAVGEYCNKAYQAICSYVQNAKAQEAPG